MANVPPHLPPNRLQYASPQQPRDIGQDAGIRMLLPVGRSGWAIAAGYAGLFAFLIIPAPIALVLAIIAIIDMKKHPERHGMGRAIFGLIIGILGTLGLILMIVVLLVGSAQSPHRSY
jgi:amino acid permease